MIQRLFRADVWYRPFHATGDDGYQSDGLARILESVMQQQTAFSLPADLGRQGLLQISTPTQEESTAAATVVSEAHGRISSVFAEPALA